MSLEQKFSAACEETKKFFKKGSDDEMLEMYGLFKQATVGDVNTARPGGMDLRGKAKWDAWNGLKGVDANTAKERYIAKVETLSAKYA